MKQGIYTILSQRNIAKNTYEMILSGDTSAFTRPGQFLNIQLDGFFLRRRFRRRVGAGPAEQVHYMGSFTGIGLFGCGHKKSPYLS